MKGRRYTKVNLWKRQQNENLRFKRTAKEAGDPMKENTETKRSQLRQEDLKRLQQLRPIDDDFMRCIFRDNKPLAQKVLRILLQNDNLTVLSVETQADMKRLVGARSICLDALAVDDTGKKYDIEIQRANHGAGVHRARYHSSVLDVESLSAGDPFESLPETYVIFITEHDIFGKGLPFYRVERINIDLGESFGDGEHILYVNGAYRGQDEIGRLMHDFSCSDPDHMLDADFAEVSKYYKENQEGVEAMCKIVEDIARDAARETAMEIAKNMIELGEVSYEYIAKVTGLPLEEIQKLAGSDIA
jgi:hypothetical protein